MTDLNTLSSPALVDIYNKIVPMLATDEMPLSTVKKFSDKATAVKRVTRMLADVNQVREKDEMLPLVVTEDGSLIQLPESGSTSDAPSDVTELRDSGALDASVSGGTLEELKSDLSASEGVVDNAPEPVPTTSVPSAPTAPASKASAAPKAPKVREPKNPGGRPALVGLTDIINLHKTDGNPKRAEAARRFAKYRDGMTVQEYIDAVGNRRQALRDIAWDMRMKWVSISGAPRVKKVADGAAPEVTTEVAPEQVDAAADAVPEVTAEAPVEQADQAA